ncbi:hypothetical protein AJ87_35765 [Rhizobium yanglingense]|nr:hypothetical protein AJ87_35765 [Rhizobium yanglingense]
MFVGDTVLIEIDDLACELVALSIARYVMGSTDAIEDSLADFNIVVLQRHFTGREMVLVMVGFLNTP